MICGLSRSGPIVDWQLVLGGRFSSTGWHVARVPMCRDLSHRLLGLTREKVEELLGDGFYYRKSDDRTLYYSLDIDPWDSTKRRYFAVRFEDGVVVRAEVVSKANDWS